MMTATEKDFGPIQSDYDFFVDHSSEAQADLASYVDGLRNSRHLSEAVRLLDFGCGPGTFTLRLLERAGWAPARLRLALVEPVDDYRNQAVERLTSQSLEPIKAWPSLPGPTSEPFDVVISNHVFYYVPEPKTALEAIGRALATGGIFLASMAGMDNALIQVWVRAFGQLGRPVPYLTAEGFEEALGAVGSTFERTRVDYDLRFPDTEENRLKMLRFLLGEHLEALSRPVALGFFDSHAHEGAIAIRTGHYQYAIPRLS